jgi:hypothetical protein
VKIWHRHEPDLKINEYIFSPYFIELYAIGLRVPPVKLCKFKNERIERVNTMPCAAVDM